MEQNNRAWGSISAEGSQKAEVDNTTLEELWHRHKQEREKTGETRACSLETPPVWAVRGAAKEHMGAKKQLQWEKVAETSSKCSRRVAQEQG